MLMPVPVSGATSGQVLKYDGTNWAPATDLTADSGSGITLNDLSVSVQSPGNASLSYDSNTGVFSFTPPDIGSLSYTADSGNNLSYVSGTYDFGNNIIKYANAVDQESDLSNYDPGTYHGMTMHVHSTGALYYAHAGAWRKLLTDTTHNNVEGAGYDDPLSDVAFDGDYNSLSNTPTVPTTLLDLSISDGTNGQILSTDGSGNFSFVDATSGGASNFDELTDVSSAGIDVNDIYEAAIVTLRVDNNSSIAYTFDSHYSGDNPTVYAISGTTIAFDLDLIGGHPFELQDSGGTPISDGLVHVSATGTVSTGSAAQGFDSGTLYWRIQESLNGTITVKRLSTL